MTFETSCDRLLSHEGGYTPGVGDPGGETKFGISKRSYPHLDIKSLTREQAKQIYLVDFWQRGAMDQFDPALSFQIFDIAVNSGIETAIRMLQRATGVADDGHIGPITIASVKKRSITDMLMLIQAERLDFMRKLSNWPLHGSGWVGRVANNLRYAAQDS